MTSAAPEESPVGWQARQVTRPRAQVEEQLREAILRGTFAQGERLPPETQLAQQFGISRPTLREALSALARVGLIRRVPGVAGGNFVNSVTPDSLSTMLSESMTTILRLGALDVEEITEVRRFLEIPAARSAATHRSPAEIEELRMIVDAQRRTTIDDVKVAGYDFAFHSLVAQASGNRLLAAFVSAVHTAATPVSYLDITPEVGKATVRQHLSILAAVESGDQDMAARAMSEHLEYVLRHSFDPSRMEAP